MPETEHKVESQSESNVKIKRLSGTEETIGMISERIYLWVNEKEMMGFYALSQLMWPLICLVIYCRQISHPFSAHGTLSNQITIFAVGPS